MCWVHRCNFWLYIGSRSSNFFLMTIHPLDEHSLYVLYMYIHYMCIYKAQDTRYSFPSGAMAKTLLANAEDTWEVGSIARSERSPGEGNGNQLRYLAWDIPWTEEPGGLPSQRVRHDWVTKQEWISFLGLYLAERKIQCLLFHFS